MYSINEQIELLDLLIILNKDTEEVCIYESILHSLQSLKQKIDCDLDYFVATMHKNDYKLFIEFLEQKHEKEKN